MRLSNRPCENCGTDTLHRGLVCSVCGGVEAAKPQFREKLKDLERQGKQKVLQAYRRAWARGYLEANVAKRVVANRRIAHAIGKGIKPGKERTRV